MCSTLSCKSFPFISFLSFWEWGYYLVNFLFFILILIFIIIYWFVYLFFFIYMFYFWLIDLLMYLLVGLLVYLFIKCWKDFAFGWVRTIRSGWNLFHERCQQTNVIISVIISIVIIIVPIIIPIIIPITIGLLPFVIIVVAALRKFFKINDFTTRWRECPCLVYCFLLLIDPSACDKDRSCRRIVWKILGNRIYSASLQRGCTRAILALGWKC